MTVGEVFFMIPLVLTSVVFGLSLIGLKDSGSDEERDRQSRWHY